MSDQDKLTTSQLSSLYREGATELPSESIDQAIILQAKKQVVAGRSMDDSDRDSKRRIESSWRRWSWPVSAAAVVVITSSLVLDLHQSEQLSIQPSHFPTINVPAIETPAIETPAIETPAMDSPAVNAPSTDELSIEEANTDGVFLEKRALEKSTVEKPVLEKLTAFDEQDKPKKRATFSASESRSSAKPMTELEASPNMLSAPQDQVSRMKDAKKLKQQTTQRKQEKRDRFSPAIEEDLAHIRALIEEGNMKDAKIQLRLFVETYPKYPLDDVLNSILIEP